MQVYSSLVVIVHLENCLSCAHQAQCSTQAVTCVSDQAVRAQRGVTEYLKLRRVSPAPSVHVVWKRTHRFGPASTALCWHLFGPGGELLSSVVGLLLGSFERGVPGAGKLVAQMAFLTL